MPDTGITDEINIEERARQQIDKTGAKVKLKKASDRGKWALAVIALLLLRGR